MILGLGNPGATYELTRHNIGFMVVDMFREKYKIPLNADGYYSQYGRGEMDDIQVMVAKPMTFMNESGKAARALTTGLELSSERVIVVHDDIDLVLGKIRVRNKGSDAGQRGVRSVVKCLQTDKFTRVRIGIGRPEKIEDIVDYVLSPFLENEWPLVNDILEQAVGKIEATLIKLNNKKTQSEEEIE